MINSINRSDGALLRITWTALTCDELRITPFSKTSLIIMIIAIAIVFGE